MTQNDKVVNKKEILIILEHMCYNYHLHQNIYGRFRTRKFCHFYIIFHSIVQTNMKGKLVSWLSSSTTIKQYKLSSGCLEGNASLL